VLCSKKKPRTGITITLGFIFCDNQRNGED
jgi:hypothetical protein